MAKKIRTKEDRIIELLGAVCEKLDKVLTALKVEDRELPAPSYDPLNAEFKYGPMNGGSRSED
jgi:hypothetical protein